jgi:hypothetical protein
MRGWYLDHWVWIVLHSSIPTHHGLVSWSPQSSPRGNLFVDPVFLIRLFQDSVHVKILKHARKRGRDTFRTENELNRHHFLFEVWHCLFFIVLLK